jgi:RNA polymerase sigma-70 factor (ECF subfamily)
MHTLQPSTRNDVNTRATDERHLRLDAMFREHAPRILDYARHRGATLVEAEDVVSEVFIVLTRRLDDAPAEVLPWLYGVARKVLGNQLRSKRRRLALKQRSEERAMWAGPADSHAAAATARDLLIRKGLSLLPEKDREALLLVAWDGLRYDEAARSLGCTRTAFAQRLCRARRRLLALIADTRTYQDADWPIVESEEA